MSRLRRPVGRLRDLPIWSKLGLIMIVPTIATIIVGTNGLIGNVQVSNDADRARTLSQLSSDVGLLVHELQDERAAATIVLGFSSANQQEITANVEAYRKHFAATDQAQRAYTARRTGLTDLPASFDTLLRSLDGQLSDLSTLRNKVAGRNQVSLTQTTFSYRVVIANLLAVRDSSVQLAGESNLSDRMRAAAAISSDKEALAQERIIVLRALGEGKDGFSPARNRELIGAITGQEQALQAFSAVATPDERSIYDQRIAGDTLRKANSLEGQVESIVNGGQTTGVSFNAADWDAAQRDRANLLREVEVELDKRTEQQATELRDQVVQQVLVEAGLLLGMLLLAILFAWMVARSMARSLRDLRHGALAVAQYGLPQAVARLRDPALATQMSPAQVAAQIADPLPVRSKDEFGQVTEAFNTVHLEAVRTAAEQAALRSSVATMFVNLARRSQILVDRLIGHLDRLERGEEDPDRLAELFQLDHLATRMRRNDENLLVLAGADSTRIQREPAALLDVLRAAQSEVEHYTRIEFGVIDRDIEVAAHAVNDLVHLIAELFDNATSFSPPDSVVVVEARRVGDRSVLLVEDRGIGISADQLIDLNERLATPPMVDVTVSRMMGLVVVARLAARHGVKVELRPARERGTIADVTLPTSVLVPRALTGRIGVTGREAPQHSDAPAAGRPAFGIPLALESGPSAGAPHTAEPTPHPFDGFNGDRSFGGDRTSGGDRSGGRPLEPGRNLFAAGGAGAAGGAASRGLPAWSDLTGVTNTNGSEPFGGRTILPSTSNDPLPQRRPGDGRTVDGEIAAGPPSPEPPAPRTTPLFGSPASGSPMMGAPVSGAQPPAPSPAFAPPPDMGTSAAPPPPAWPPAAGEDAPPPAVPGELAAALDMTAELPRVRSDRPSTSSTPNGGLAAELPPDPRTTRFADETMELPIFRELESAWFRTRRSVPESASGSSSGNGSSAPSVAGNGAIGTGPADATATTSSPTTVGRSPADAESGAATDRDSTISTPLPSRLAGTNGPAGDTSAAAGLAAPAVQPWQTAADDGWRAATAAAAVEANERTDAGLPKRVPMAQLVPGGVDRAANATQKRTPEAVRGLLSAYHRGVQRGRTQPKDPNTPEPTTAGPQPSPAGKEQEA